MRGRPNPLQAVGRDAGLKLMEIKRLREKGHRITLLNETQFWRLVGAVIGREDLPSLDYDARLAALLSAGIGLWDAVASARRGGSLDAAIRDAEHAPLAELVSGLPELRAVAFNGATSARIGRRLLAPSRARLVDLPSSSPAHAAMSFSDKRERWMMVKQFHA